MANVVEITFRVRADGAGEIPALAQAMQVLEQAQRRAAEQHASSSRSLTASGQAATAAHTAYQALAGALGTATGHLTGIGRESGGAATQVTALGRAFQYLKEGSLTTVAITGVVTAARQAFQLLGQGMGAVKGAFIDYNSTLQQTTIGFTNMLGSGEKARAFTAQLQDFANKTPFAFPELATASQRLLAFGFSAQQVVPLLTAVGNTASAMGSGEEGINRLTLALGQIQAKGKVSGDEMLQLQEAGIKTGDVFAIIGQRSGKTADQIADMASKGKLSGADFISAFEEYTKRFDGQMDAQSHSFAGAMSTIKDTLNSAGAQAFKPFFDLLTEGADRFATFLQTDKFKNFVAAIAGGAQTAAGAIRGLIAEFRLEGISGVLDSVKAKIAGFFSSLGGNESHTGGWNLIVTFAQGMYDAAESVLTKAASDIAGLVSGFFIGQSPPPKGPLKEIHKGGAMLMEEYRKGMAEGVESANFSEIGKSVLDQIGAALSAGEGGDADFGALKEMITGGALSMDDLKAASVGVDDVLHMISEQMQEISDRQSEIKDKQADIADQQASIKDQEQDIKDSYADQIDPLQRQLDIIKETVDYASQRRDLELQISDNAIAMQMNGDTALRGLESTLKGLESAQQRSRSAPIDRGDENRLAQLQRSLRDVPTGKAGAGRRDQINDEIAAIRERQRVEKDGDTDAARARQAQIDSVKQQIEDRKRIYQDKLDANKQEEMTLSLQQKQAELQRKMAELPLEQKIAGLKREEQDRLDPLEKQSHLLDTQNRALQSQSRELDGQNRALEGQRRHWAAIKVSIEDTLKPLQQAEQFNNAVAARQAQLERAAEADKKKAAGPASGGMPKSIAPGFGLQEQPLRGATDPTEGIMHLFSADNMQKRGQEIGQRLVEGLLGYLRDHAGALIGGAIGGALGSAVLGPIGGTIGALLGSNIGGQLQKTLSGLPWEKILGPLHTFVENVSADFKTGGIGKVFDDLSAAAGEALPKILAQLGKWGEAFESWLKPHIGPAVDQVATLGARLFDWMEGTALPAVRDHLLKWADEFVHWIGPKIPDILVELGKVWLATEKFIGETLLKIAGLLLKWGEEFVKWVGPRIGPMLDELGKLFARMMDWVTGQLPTLVDNIGKWAKEFIAWIAPHIPPFLEELGKLSVALLGWIAERAPGIAEKLLVWSLKFVGFVIELFPKMLVELLVLEGKLLGWVVDEAPKLGEKLVKEWIPAAVKWVGTMLEPGNPDGLVKKLEGVGGAIKDWVTNFAKKDLPGIVEGFIQPFLSPFDKIMAGIKTFTGWIGRGLHWLTGKIGAPDIVPEAGYTETNAKLYAKGGVIDEEVHGVGLRSGRKYVLGEAGREMVVPLAERAAALSVPMSHAMEHGDRLGTILGGSPLDIGRSLLSGIASLAGTVRDFGQQIVEWGEERTARAAMDAAGVLGDFLPAAFSSVGAALVRQVPGWFVDIAKGLIDKIKGDHLIGGGPGSGRWHHPVPGYHYIQGSWTHGGTHDNEAAVDWPTPYGTPIHAPDSGTAYTTWNGDGATGRTGIIDHLNGWKTYYGHVSRWSEGPFGQDDIVGQTGSPEADGGAGAGAHLHFAMRLNGAYERPEDLIPGAATGGVTESGGLYNLHPGEAVIPLDKAAARGLVGGGDINVNVTVNGRVLTTRDLVLEILDGLRQEKARRGDLGL